MFLDKRFIFRHEAVHFHFIIPVVCESSINVRQRKLRKVGNDLLW